jgi:hypothetical protein
MQSQHHGGMSTLGSSSEHVEQKRTSVFESVAYAI